MAQIRGGLHREEDQNERLEMEGTIHFEADRKKGGMEKQLENLFFGGQYPKKPKTIPEPNRNSAQPINQTPNIPRIKQTKEESRSPAKPSGKATEKPSAAKPNEKPSGGKSPVNKSPPKPAAIRDNYVSPADQDQDDGQDERRPSNRGGGQIPQQPEPYVVVDMGDPYRMPLQIKKLHNKPIYTRKFKKVAEDFNFVSDNKAKHIAIDVMRPKECDKGVVLEAWVPDYMDAQFPPNERAMGRQHKGLVSEWRRVKHVCKTPVMGKYVDPNDIVAGRFSSPEFLSTLCCLAEKEQNIKRIIEDQTYNDDGFYYVRINQNAVWRFVPVDDYIPMLGMVPALASSHLDQETDLWISLVEKAYAKAFLQGFTLYKKVQSHQIYLRDLTGAPCQVHPMNNPDTILVIKDALDKGQSVIAVGNEQALNVGLNPNYAFNVLKCDPKAGLEMRNSWGSIEERTKLNTTKEGTFNMSLQQCRDFLNHVIIGRINDDYHSSVIRAKHRPGFYGSYTFRVSEDTVGTLSVSQLDERMMPPNSGYMYSPIRMVLQKRTENGPVYVNSVFNIKLRNVDMDVILNEGQYVLHVIANWIGNEYDYFVSFYGDKNINFKKYYNKHTPNDISQHLHAVNAKNGKKSSRGAVNEYIYHHPVSNLILITAENTGQKAVDHNVDLSKADFKKLLLVNAKSQDDTFHDKSRSELDQYKQQANTNRKWNVRLQPKQSYTWVLASAENYSASILNKWGLK